MKTSTLVKRADIRQPLNFEPTYQYDSAILASILGQTLNAVYVSESTVGGLPAIGRGIDMVANAVATMMTSAEVILPGGDPAETVPSVLKRPNVIFSAAEYWRMVVGSLMMRGNFVGIKADYDSAGFPRQIVPVHPDAVTMDVTTGVPIYKVHDQLYSFDEIVHLRANTVTGGLWGQGVIERYRSTLEGQLYEQAYGANTYKNGSVPSAVIQLDTPTVDEDTAEAVQTSWISKHGAGERKPAVISNKMNITPIGWSPKDTDWIEGRKLSIAECALMCGLDPSDLSAAVGNTSLTYANLTQRQLSRISDSYAPWMNLIEQGWSDLIPGNSIVRGKAEALLRTSTAERYDLHKSALDAGWLTKDEVRDIEGYGPLPEQPAPPVQLVAPADDEGDTDDE